MNLELIYVIVAEGAADRLIHTAREEGMSDATTFMGFGTYEGGRWSFWGLDRTRKEIIVMLAHEKTARRVMAALAERHYLERPGQGISFSTPVGSVWGGTTFQSPDAMQERKEQAMYELITVIVDKGKAEEAMAAATAAGAQGGTIVNARGAGPHETARVFMMDIQPEKEMLLLLTPQHKTQALCEAIAAQMDLEEPGAGILYVQPVVRTYGAVE